jgi:hypothetical protein
MKKLIQNKLSSIQSKLSNFAYNPPTVVLFLCSLRDVLWGACLDFKFHVLLPQLNYIVNPYIGSVVLLFGLIGIFGAIKNNYILTLIYCIFNIFSLAVLCITYLESDANINGISYLIDLLMNIWLIYKVQYNKMNPVDIVSIR